MKIKHIIIAAAITFAVYLFNNYKISFEQEADNEQETLTETVADEPYTVPDYEKENALQTIGFFLMCDSINREFQKNFIDGTPYEIEETKKVIQYLKKGKEQRNRPYVNIWVHDTDYGLEHSKGAIIPPNTFGIQQDTIKTYSNQMLESARQLLPLKGELERFGSELSAERYPQAQALKVLEEILPKIEQQYRLYTQSEAQLFAMLAPKLEKAEAIMLQKMTDTTAYTTYKQYLAQITAFTDEVQQQVKHKKYDLKALESTFEAFKDEYYLNYIDIEVIDSPYLRKESFEYIAGEITEIFYYFPILLQNIKERKPIEGSDFYDAIEAAATALKQYNSYRFFKAPMRHYL